MKHRPSQLDDIEETAEKASKFIFVFSLMLLILSILFIGLGVYVATKLS